MATVLLAFALKKVLEPVTGTGAPYVLLFGAVVATSLWAGPGPGILATFLSLPLGAYVFVVRAGYSYSQAASQAALFFIDGLIIVYLSTVMMRARRAAEEAVARERGSRHEVETSNHQLRASEARFSGIIAVSADAIISIDGDQRIVLFNDGAEKIFGYPRSEVIGAPLDVLIPDALRRRHRRHVAEFASSHVTSRGMGERLTTIMGRRKNGEQFPAEAAISKLEVGGQTILTVAVRDASERKRQEREQTFLAEAGAVLSSSLDYEQTLTTVGQLAVRQVADWCIIDVVEGGDRPRRLKVVAGDPRQDDLAARLERLPLDHARPHVARPAFQTRRPFVVERMTSELLESFAQSAEHLEILRSVAPRSLMTLPLLIRGELLGALVLISTAPDRAYDRRDLRMAEALADRAALAIENGLLYRRALRATQLRDEVLGVVAHDLRNPLAAIVMRAKDLRRSAPVPEPQARKTSDGILRAANRMNRLIDDLLDVTLIEAGQLGIEHARLSAREIVAEAVEAQRPLVSSAFLEMRVEVPSDLPDVQGDQHRLLQVLQNLIGNAVKFTPVQGRITVAAAPRGGEVLFWVADTGCGISPEGMPHVFDRFWQARKGRRRGAGLGLPIARGIIEAHGGRIWVESTLGRGSVFFFTIPRAGPEQSRRLEVMH